MKRKDAARAVMLNAEAVEWTRTHTLQDLEELVGELSGQGDEVDVMVRLLDELRQIEQDLHGEPELGPTASEHAEIAG